MIDVERVSGETLPEFRLLCQCLLPVAYSPAFYRSVAEEKVVAYIGRIGGKVQKGEPFVSRSNQR